MSGAGRTQEQLVQELARVRQRLADLESVERERKQAQDLLHQCAADLEARNRDLDDVARYVISEFKSPLGIVVGFAELLETEFETLSEQELRYCANIIAENGRKIGKMINGLLLLASSHRLLFDNVWYAAYLAAMGEKSFPQWALEWEKDIVEAYRFTCLPASAAPLIVRVWRTSNAPPSFQAVAKFGSWQTGYSDENNPDQQETEWSLTAKEWGDLVAAIEGSQFWADSSALEQLGWSRMVGGGGGEEWIFEGWRDGQHKIRTIWNPDEKRAPAAHTLGRTFVKFLPDWFALEMARLWAVDAHFRDDLDLSALLNQ